MTWTSDKPTQPGWYWWRNRVGVPKPYHDDEIVKVYLKRGHLNIAFMNGNRIDGIDIAGEWAGLLEPPKEDT